MEEGVIRANFRFTTSALQAIQYLWDEYRESEPSDPPCAISVGWGLIVGDPDPDAGMIIIGFYPESLRRDIEHGIQYVDNVPLIFFTTPEYSPKFEGRWIDYTDEIGFFLAGVPRRPLNAVLSRQ